jgi:acetyl esterase/lipase
MLAWFARYALPRPSFGRNPLASPLYANVRGLPPATVVLAEIDPLLSQGVNYSNKLRRAGVPVRQRLFMGVTHEFFGMGAVVDQGKQAVAFAAAGLRNAFAR